MASNYWIKLYHEILDDPKMMRMSEVLFSRCIKLFLLAGDCNDSGRLPSVKDAAWRLRVSEEEMETDFVELQKHGILEQSDGVWAVKNWEKRQGAMSGSERTRRWRESKKKQEYEERGPADVTAGERNRDGIETNRHTEEEKNKKKKRKKRAQSGKKRQSDSRLDSKKQKALFYPTAEILFGITAKDFPGHTRQHVARTRDALIEVDGDLDKETLRGFSKWWKKNFENATLPQDPAKAQRHFMAYKSNPDADPRRIRESDDEWRRRVLGD